MPPNNLDSKLSPCLIFAPGQKRTDGCLHSPGWRRGSSLLSPCIRQLSGEQVLRLPTLGQQPGRLGGKGRHRRATYSLFGFGTALEIGVSLLKQKKKAFHRLRGVRVDWPRSQFSRDAGSVLVTTVSAPRLLSLRPLRRAVSQRLEQNALCDGNTRDAPYRPAKHNTHTRGCLRPLPEYPALNPGHPSG